MEMELISAAITATSLDLLTNGGNNRFWCGFSELVWPSLIPLVSAIALGDGTTANFGSLDFAGSAVTISEASAMEIAASEATGALNLTASGAITQAGVDRRDFNIQFQCGSEVRLP